MGRIPPRARAKRGGSADVVNQHRDPDVLVVEMPSVRPMPLAKSLAMVARHDNHRIVQVVFRGECVEQLVDDAVGLPDLVVVSVALLQLIEDRVRLVAGIDQVVRACEDVRLGKLHAQVVRGHQMHVQERRMIG